jgi:hypothetical protein
MIETASWADFGYRKLAPLPTSGSGLLPADIAARLTQHGDYHATSDHWVRRVARRKGSIFGGSIQIVSTLV